MDKWLITDKVHESAESQLLSMGFQVDSRPDISNDEVLNVIDQYFGLIISTKTTINKQLVDKATHLKIIGRVGAGMDHVDQEYCSEKGIQCFNSPGGNANAVAEHVIGMLFGFSKHIFRANHQVKNGKWERFPNTGFEIKGRTVGIIGFGNTGSMLAKKLSGFDCKVLVYDKYKSGFGNEYTIESDIETIENEAEVISFHIPHTKETHYWISKQLINNCKQKPLIINTSRGAISNIEDVVWALQNEKIRGYCVDVFEDEPLDKEQFNAAKLYQQLLEFDNVIVSPHIAGWSFEAKKRMVDILMIRITDFLKKQATNKQLN